MESGKRIEFLTAEETYDKNNAEVIYWTDFFLNESKKKNVFINIQEVLSTKNNFTTAQVFAGVWHEFTRFVPGFLTRAVIIANEPEWQHYFIQIAYDELGGRDIENIHSRLFEKIIDQEKITFHLDKNRYQITHVLDEITGDLNNSTTLYEIGGLLLSFEIVAEQNIEMLFTGLCYKEDLKNSLSESKFFKIHRTNESEHIRHSIADYIRLCKEDHEKRQFCLSFDKGLQFWQRFWDQMARLALAEDIGASTSLA